MSKSGGDFESLAARLDRHFTDLAAVAALDHVYKRQMVVELVVIAREIKRRDNCSDVEAIDKAMVEYDRLVAELRVKHETEKREEEERKARAREEAALRAQGKPTLKVGLSSAKGFAGLAALRDKLAGGTK